MEKILSEDEIVTHIRKSIDYHRKKISYLENALTALTCSHHTDDPLNENLTRMWFMDGANGSETNILQVRQQKEALLPIDIPKEYHQDLSLRQKVIFALSKLLSGSVKDVVEKIMMLEPELDIDKISPQVAVYLSLLRKNRQVNGLKWGKVTIYSL